VRAREAETVAGELLLRRVVVGALATNAYVVADTASRHAVVVDPGDEPDRVLDAVHDLHVMSIVLTHAHWDHVLGVADVADRTGAPILLHPMDHAVWPHEQEHLHRHGHFDAGTATEQLVACGCPPVPPVGVEVWDGEHRALHDGTELRLGEHTVMTAMHTPGHTPGGISLAVGSHVLTGDTLFPGGPGLTGWPLSDFSTIISSIEHRLFGLPDHTVVHPGHGATTTIGAERPRLPEWIERGW
jgi:hydroxyacylglutathione hydrolase